MRLLIGSDIGNYIFHPELKKVSFINIPYELELKNIFSIFNINSGVMVYSFARPGFSGTITNNTLTLNYDSTSMDPTDELQIIVDIPDNYISSDVGDAVRKLISVLAPLAAVADRTNNRAKCSATIEGGSLTTISTVTTCTTLRNIGAYSADIVGFNISNNTWNNNVGRRFI